MPIFHPCNTPAISEPFVREGQQALAIVEKVFWLPDHPVSRAFSGSCRMTFAAFVPGYSGGTTTDLHRLPDSNVMKMLIHGWH